MTTTTTMTNMTKRFDETHEDDISVSSSSTAAPSSSSSSSIDTQDAFLEMLGLAKEGNEFPSFAITDDDDDECIDDECIDIPTTTTTTTTKAIHIPLKCSRYHIAPSHCCAFTIDNFYTSAQCDDLLALATATAAGRPSFQYITEASHVGPDGTSYKVQLQHPNPHKLAVVDHPPTIQHMWNTFSKTWEFRKMIQPFVERCQCGPPLGLNPRVRILRYDASDSDRFEPHFDATTTFPKQQSRLTVLLYLNDGDGQEFTGGETYFLNSHISSTSRSSSSLLSSSSSPPLPLTMTTKEQEGIVKITPQKGKMVIFEHDLYHSGAPLDWGTKYVLRTDILFAMNEQHQHQQQQQQQQQHDNDNEKNSNHDGMATANHNIVDNNTTTTTTTITTTPPITPCLVSDVCHDLGFLPHQMQILIDMDMWDTTLESFLAPGIDTVKMMLEEEFQNNVKEDDAGGGGIPLLQQLLQKALEITTNAR